MIICYLVALLWTYANTRNLLSFQVMFAGVSLPPALASSELVGWLITFGVLFMAIGGSFYNLLARHRPKQALATFRAQPVQFSVFPKKSFLLAFWLLTTISVAGSCFYFYNVGISLFAEEVGFARLVNRHAVSGSFIYQRLFRVWLPILCLIYFLIGSCAQTKRYYNRLVFLTLLIVTASLNIFTGMRGNVVIFIFYPMLALFGVYGPKVRISQIGLMFLGTLSFGAYVSILMYPSLGVNELSLLILARISSSATDGLSYMAHVDAVQNGFYFGKTYFNDVMSVFYKLGLTTDSYSNYGAHLAKSMLGERYNGEQAAIYVMGELYANFGFFGLSIGSVFLGMFMQKLYVSTITAQKDILYTSVKVYFGALFLAILGGPSISMFFDYLITISGFVVAYVVSFLLFSMRNDTAMISRLCFRLRLF